MNAHEIIEQRSIALHKLVAEKIRDEPSFVNKAKFNLDFMLSQNKSSAPYMTEWKVLIEGSIDNLLSALILDNQKMRALRQCSPFAGILDPKERWQVYESFKS